MTESPEIFLDTSIHMSKHKGKPFEEKICSHLKKFKWLGTSSYTITEFGNNILTEVQYYLRKLREFDSVEELISHIAHNIPLQYPRMQKKIRWAFTLLIKHYGDDAETATFSLEGLMKYHGREAAVRCDEVVDGTKCYYAKNGVSRKKDGSLVWNKPDCRKNRVRCKINSFFTEHKKQFVSLAEHIESLPEEKRTQQLEQFAEIIRQAEKEPSILLDYKNCKRLADALIAMDSLGYRSFFTQNIKESEVLCNFFDQSLYYMSNDLKKDVRFIPPNPKKDKGNGGSVSEPEIPYEKSKTPGK